MYKVVIPHIRNEIVGREKELDLIIACLEAGKNILLEGPPGTSKSTILGLVAKYAQLPIHILEGNADLTPAKLIGNFDPAMVIEHGMKPEYFNKGPLYSAMEDGGLLYIDEFNRMASDASNVLIRAIEENEIVVPRIGLIKAQSNFRVILAQNPFDDVGVGKISRALYDRLLRVRMEYQTELEEKEIVKTSQHGYNNTMVQVAVQLTRATRHHNDLKQGSSVRGAIDMLAMMTSLADLQSGNRSDYEIIRDSALTALSGKIWLDSSSDKTAEEIIEELLKGVLEANKLTIEEDTEDFLEQLKKKVS